jgi:hypothetical protein
MVDLSIIPPLPEAGDRQPGEGNFYQRTPRRPPPPAPESPPPAAPPADVPAVPDPVAPLVEQLERLRATQHSEADSDSRRFVRGPAAYREANQAALVAEALRDAGQHLAQVDAGSAAAAAPEDDGLPAQDLPPAPAGPVSLDLPPAAGPPPGPT